MSTRALPAWILAALLPLTALAAPLADAKPRKPRARAALADRTAPKVSFVAPLKGSTVFGTLTDSTCRVSARDNVSVRKVVFAVDGVTLSTDVQAPWTCAWDTRSVANGRHTIRATAYDAAGNRGSVGVAVTVSNPTATATEPAPTTTQTSEPAPAPTTTTTTTTAPAPAPAPAPTPVEAPAPASVAITGRTFYVSPTGSDANAGTSSTAPWRTVGKVNNAALAPGDGVLFQAGATLSDATLMPGQSGGAGAPIVFGSYGAGKAKLTQGVWFSSKSWLTFTNLEIAGASQGISASAGGSGSDHIVVSGTNIHDVSIAVNSANMADDDWTIQDNTVSQTGDSGMILLGSRFLVAGNTITDTGTNTGITYGKHGIYLKVIDARVLGNTIRRFHANGVSVRYRNSVVDGNVIEGGPIGIAWFQYDPVAGTSRWTNNQISRTTATCVYVSPSDEGGATRESFVISGNTMSKTSGSYTDLKATSGTYTVQSNSLL